MNGSAKNGEGKDDDDKPWRKDRTSLLAVVALIISVASAGISGYLGYQAYKVAKEQGVVAAQQAVVAEQEELVSLVSSIAQEPATIAQESGNLQDNSSTQHNTEVVGTQLTALADGEEADYLIGLLPSGSVTAEEYYFTAIGLQAGESSAPALGLLGKAATLKADPRTQANVFRAEAQILYQDGDDSQAFHDIQLALGAFGPKGTTSEVYQYNLAYTDFFDAQFQALINCKVAHNEVASAETSLNMIKENPGANATALMNQETVDEGIPNINKPIPFGAAQKPRPCKDL